MLTGICLFLVYAVILIACHKVGLRRFANDEVLGGVCAGIAARVNLTPALVRTLTVLAALFTGGTVIVLYILLWITLPKD